MKPSLLALSDITEEQPELPIDEAMVPVPEQADTKWKKPRTRKNRKGITLYVDVATHKEVARLCFEQDRTQQEVMREAVALLFVKYGVVATE